MGRGIPVLLGSVGGRLCRTDGDPKNIDAGGAMCLSAGADSYFFGEPMVTTHPNVEDPDASEPRAVHIRSTALGYARSVSAPTLCGVSPSLAWHLSQGPPTCPTCIAEVRRIQLRIFWRA